MDEQILFTSESVSEGHPDKICDQVSDAVLDACLALDPNAHVAVECYASEQHLTIGGQVSLAPGVAVPDYEAIARKVIREIGYTDPRLGFSADEARVEVLINPQSVEINNVVAAVDPLMTGAGDQGIMFGYATTEDRNYMPLAIVIAHKLMRVASAMRKEGRFPHARPDMKSQVTVDYTNPKAIRVDTIVMAVQHDPDIDVPAFKRFVHDQIMIPVVKSFNMNIDFKYYVNDSGTFVNGGPRSDTGLTGRKIIVDTYGGAARHGGGAFSGKDATKVDRSAAYMARYIAKNLVAAGYARRLEIQLSYGIGMVEPISYAIFTYKTRAPGVTDRMILTIIKRCFDCRPGAIIKAFGLQRPGFRYQDLASYGHIGRNDLDLPWERLDQVERLKEELQKYRANDANHF
ncbi:MAG: methionine adenosyltransferase [Bacilli bacterium]|jgi:S-adenosylmethionine synthetase